jgi:hypothetical protein
MHILLRIFCNIKKKGNKPFFFMQDAIWVSLPDWAMGNAFIYSLIYQCVYIPADALLAILVLITLCKTGVLDRLSAIMKKGK